MMASVVGRPSRLPALTGIRFFAALHVVVFHYGTEALANAHWSIRAFVASGPTAVSLFYVLSGVVLVYSSTDHSGQLKPTRQSFWRSRFARIYPTYLLALILDAPFFLSALLNTHSGTDAALWGIGLALPALFLVHAWTALTVFAWNTPGWSLSAEAFFYAVFPSAVGRLSSASTRQLVGRALVLYAIALVPPLLVTVARLSASPLLQVQIPSGPGGLDLYTWIVRLCGFSPLARLPEFLIGICLGHWLRDRGTRITLSAAQALAFESTALGILAGLMIALGAYPNSKPWVDSGLLSPAFALSIAVLAIGSGPLARLFSTRPLQEVGDASYAMYILQEPILIWMLHVPFVGMLPTHVFVPIFIVVLIGASVLCQRFIAEPVRIRLLHRRRSVGRSASVAIQPLS